MPSQAELRGQVVHAALAMLEAGLVAGTSGNVSARAGESVLITPTGLPYEEMTDADLVALSPEGKVISGEREPSSERFVHLAVYAARPDAAAIIHTHSVHATAWSFLDEPLDTGTEELELAAGGGVSTSSYADSGSHAIAAAAVAALEGRQAALMARHGALAIGPSPARALDVAHVVERQARIAWLLRGTR